jgi:hypothetical protein
VGRIRLGRRGARLYREARAAGLGAVRAADAARVALAWERAEAAGLVEWHAEGDYFEGDEWAEDARALAEAEAAVRYLNAEADDAERERQNAEAEAAEARAWSPDVLAEAEGVAARARLDYAEAARHADTLAARRIAEAERLAKLAAWYAEPERRREALAFEREARRAERRTLGRLAGAERREEAARRRLAEWERLECYSVAGRFRLAEGERWHVGDALGGVWVGPRDRDEIDALGGRFDGYAPEIMAATLRALAEALRERPRRGLAAARRAVAGALAAGHGAASLAAAAAEARP